MNRTDLIRLRSKIIAALATHEVTASDARNTLKESSEVNPNCLQDLSDANKGEMDLKNTLKIHNHCTKQQAILRAALARMESGDYGICHDCGLEINLRRLEVNPGAVLCITCQKYREHEEGYATPAQAFIPKTQMRSAA